MVNFIKPCEGRVTSPFGFRIHPISHSKKMHWGVDYGNTPSDNTIIASADGVVDRASAFEGYGNTIIITHKIGDVTYQTLYAHLASMSVKVGATVKQGQKIGVKGTTGNSTGIHLHFEVHKGGKRNSSYTYAVDPVLCVVDSEVLNLQKLLNNHGYKLIVDGITGDTTTNAIKSFQTKNGLVADGIAGTKTIEELMYKAEVKAVSVEKKEETRMYKPSTNTLEDEMALLLEDAFKEGLLKSIEWAKKARTGKLTLDDAAGLQAAILRRKLASMKK